MIVVRFDEPQEYHAPGQETRRVKVFIDEERIKRKDIELGMAVYGPGMSAPSHTHKGSETLFIIHGKGEFGTKEKTVDVASGDVLYFAPGEEHFLRNIGSQTLEFAFVYSQPGDASPLKEKWVALKKKHSRVSEAHAE